MSQAEHRRWLITGCSTGFGRYLAEAVLARGDKLLLTARSPEVLQDLAALYPDTARVAKLDVTNQADIDGAVALADKEFGGIDVLVNNAGFSVVGAIEELEPEEYLPLYEANLFGVVNMTRAVVKQMRERRSGVLAVVSSMAGQNPSPGMAHYSATKSGVEMIYEGMQGELKDFGIRMLIIEPGLFRTAIIGSLRYPKNPIDDYQASSGAVKQRMQSAVGKEPGDPRKAAQKIIQQVYDDNAPLRLPVGFGSTDRIKERLARLAVNMDAVKAIADDTNFDPA
jgi:NAD(P)-dependent dehydrogenase (short-subunit alcohol dehydrogenase family)